MEVIPFQMEYYPMLYSVLRDKGIADKDMSLLNIETRVLIDNEELIGFYSAEKIMDIYNLHHFCVCKVSHKALWRLVLDLINYAKKRDCKYITLHVEQDSKLERFVIKFCKRKRFQILMFNYKNFNFYKVEV